MKLSSHRRLIVLASLIACGWATSASLLAQAPFALRGRVVAVADGDTITVLDASNTQHRVRLNGIDAPETGQAFSQVSKTHLSDLVFGKIVDVAWSKIDRYGRLIGTVAIGATNANLEQLRAGLAWYYHEYATDIPMDLREPYAIAEAEAKAAQLGLWRDRTPVAPWAYRHLEMTAPPVAAPTPVVPRALAAPTPAPTLRVIGNRNSRIYHLPGCGSYNAVAERNRVYFATEADARAAGYRKAGNC